MSAAVHSHSKQPQGLFFLLFTQVWESFSFYGMRVLLVLYLTSQLNYMEGNAFALYALYTTLIELGAFIGGYLADRFLGLRTAVLLGGCLIGAGHLCLTFSEHPELFFLGLGSIICGTTLFRGNLKAMVGQLYGEHDPRRESGFTLFYTGINLGGFAAALLCGFLAQTYGWHVGFGAAAIGMLIGIGIFLIGLQYLGEIGKAPQSSPAGILLFSLIGSLGACICFGYFLSQYEVSQMYFLVSAVAIFTALIVIIGKQLPVKHTLGMIGILGLVIIYFIFEELMGSMLMIFLEKNVDRTIAGFEIPSTMLAATNPFIIITLGPLLSFIMNRIPFNRILKLAFAFLCLTLAFSVLYSTSLMQFTTAFDVTLSFAFIALGELFIAPTVFAYCSEIAPAQSKGLMMGVVTTAFALANLMSGQLSQMSSLGDDSAISGLFLGIACCSAFISFLLFLSLAGTRLLIHVTQK